MFAVLLGVLLFIDRVIGSRFGLVLQGCRQNERRLEAVGYPTFRYKLVAFVIAGAIAGFAGVLLAASQQFVSPADLAWTRSGELVIMLVLGGVGTLFGPLFGAAFYVVLELVLGSWTTHWQIVFGPVFIFFVLFVKGGIAGCSRGHSGGEGPMPEPILEARNLVQRFGALVATDDLSLRSCCRTSCMRLSGRMARARPRWSRCWPARLRPTAGAIFLAGEDSPVCRFGAVAQGHRALVPDHVALSGILGAGECCARRAGASGPQLPHVLAVSATTTP